MRDAVQDASAVARATDLARDRLRVAEVPRAARDARAAVRACPRRALTVR